MDDLERIERALRAAHEAGDEEAARRLAIAYREAQSSAAPSRLPEGVGEQRANVGERALDWLGRGARNANTGILNMLGQGDTRLAEELGELGVTRPRGQGAETMTDAAFESLGLATPLTGAGVFGAVRNFAMPVIRGATSQAPFRGATLPTIRGAEAQSQAMVSPTLPNPSVAATLLRDVADTATRSPGMFFGTEAGGALGAGALMHGAQEQGGGPLAQMTAALLGGLTGGTAPMALNRGLRGLYQGTMSHLAPFTETGALPRAARGLQDRAENVNAAVRNLDEWDRPGVTPARASGDQGLMAVEARQLADDPILRDEVNASLRTARVAAQQELRDQFGRPRSREDWERSVLENVAARDRQGNRVGSIEGTHTDEMLESAYRSFDPLYDAARGRAMGQFVDVDGVAVPLRRHLTSASRDESVMADDSTRRTVSNWLDNQYTALSGQADEAGEVTTDAMIQLRSRIRDEQRRLGRDLTTEGRARRELLDGAEQRLTQTIENALPPNIRADLQSADRQYAQYKIVEDAIYRAADQPLTPEQLSASIQAATQSPSAYARGQNPVEQNLRQLATAGRSTETVFDDPRRAAQMVRGLDDDGRRAVHAEFAETLFRRARDAGETIDGQTYISGQRLLQDLNDQREVAQALGVPLQEFSRMQRIAREIARMEAAQPAAVENMLADGPSTLAQLGAAILGAKSGQNIAGSGIGSSLVIAQFMSNRARRLLTMITGDHAEKMMLDAARNPRLYRALLVDRSSPQRHVDEAAQALNAWLINNVEPTLEAAENTVGTLPQPEIPGG